MPDAARGLVATIVLALLVVPVVLLAQSWVVPVLVGALAAVAALLIIRQRGVGQASAPLGVAAGTLLCFVIPFTFVGLTPDVPLGAWAAALLISLGAGLRLAWIIGDGAQRLVEAMVWTFVYVFLGLAPMVQLRTSTDPATTPPVHHSLDATALAVVIVGTAAFALGLVCARAGDRGARARGPAPAIQPARVTALAVVGLACAAYFALEVGPVSLVGTRFGLDRATAATWGNVTIAAVIRSLAIMPLLVAFVAFQVQRSRRPRSGWLTTVLLPVCTGAVVLLVANPVANARYTAGTVYLAVLTSLGLVATRPRFRAVIAGFVVSVILLFPLADAYRSTDTSPVQGIDPVAALTTGDFDAFAQVVNTVQYVQEHGITYGYQALGPLVFWIPRDLWPQKPVDTGILIAESRGHAFTNLSAPLWAELFINGGWLLLVAGMVVFGMLVRRWDNRLVQRMRTYPTPGVLSCILPFYLLIVLRGSLLQATSSLVVIVLCAWFVRDGRAAAVQAPAARPAAVTREEPHLPHDG